MSVEYKDFLGIPYKTFYMYRETYKGVYLKYLT